MSKNRWNGCGERLEVNRIIISFFPKEREAPMAINILRAAKHLCKVSDWTLTNLELQKIIYLCHMEFFGEKGKPLVEGEFEAWVYGPVHPTLYHRLKRFGRNSIPESNFRRIKDLDSNKHRDEINMLTEWSEVFPHPSGPILVAITHREGSAWEKVYEDGIKGSVIPRGYILQEYKDLKKECLK